VELRSWSQTLQDTLFADNYQDDDDHGTEYGGAPWECFRVERRVDDIHIREIVIRAAWQDRGIGAWLLNQRKRKLSGAGYRYGGHPFG
jgi:GNAT superfamily N-acetyltransferase